VAARKRRSRSGLASPDKKVRQAAKMKIEKQVYDAVIGGNVRKGRVAAEWRRSVGVGR
jgi:hypothetical protein